MADDQPSGAQVHEQKRLAFVRLAELSPKQRRKGGVTTSLTPSGGILASGSFGFSTMLSIWMDIC